MNCVSCGEQPFGISKLLRYQLTADSENQSRVKCDHCGTSLIQIQRTGTNTVKLVFSMLLLLAVAIPFFIYIDLQFLNDLPAPLWFAVSIAYIVIFTILASKLNLKFISFQPDSNNDPVMIMKIRKPGWMVFTAWMIISIVLITYYLNTIDPMFTDPQWGGIVFILFFGLLLGIGGYLLKYYSEKVPA